MHGLWHNRAWIYLKHTPRSRQVNTDAACSERVGYKERIDEGGEVAPGSPLQLRQLEMRRLAHDGKDCCGL